MPLSVAVAVPPLDQLNGSIGNRTLEVEAVTVVLKVTAVEPLVAVILIVPELFRSYVPEVNGQGVERFPDVPLTAGENVIG